jgi:hypothetical protein
MFIPISFLCSLALATMNIACTKSNQPSVNQISQPKPLILREQPVSLDNPDGRCVRNAISQMMVPAVIDILNTHFERTGVLLDDAYWVVLFQNSLGKRARAELTAAGLARTALGINSWSSPLPIGTHSFNSVLELSHYGLGATQYSLLVRDIVDGINQLTNIRMLYCQLPLDREHVKEFSTQDYLQSTLKENVCDYLMIDAGSSTTRAFDKHSCLGNIPLSTYNEKALPANFTFAHYDGTIHTYEIVSFCNMERSGVAVKPSVWSRTMRGIQWLSGLGALPYETFPTRHATTVVKYGDTWFTTCDTCVRQVVSETNANSSDIAQSLLAHYPGMRIIALYKKVNNVPAPGDVTNDKNVTLFLKRVSPDSNIPLTEIPLIHVLAVLASFTFMATSMTMFKLARCNIQQIIAHSLGQKITQAGMGIVLLATTLPPCGNVVSFVNNALIAHKKKAMLLKIDPKKDHASGLYSTEIESCKTVNMIVPNPENGIAKQ